jgi:autotransporter-associated beta strand protein
MNFGNDPLGDSPMVPVRRLALALVTPLVATLTITAPAAAQSTFTWTNSATNGWLTAGDWSPSTNFPGLTGFGTGNNPGDTANFASTLPSGNVEGIDMSPGSNNANQLLRLGAITFSSTSNLAIGNSSNNKSGTLQLNGATVNGQIETILSNSSGSQTLTIQNSVGSGTQPLTVLLGSLPTGGVGYVVASTGSTINIAAAISDGGTPKGITVPGSGTVILSGTNVYSGTTLVTGGTLQVANTTGSATGSGMVQVASPARLSGTGTITGLGVDVGGKLQPGTDAAAGTLTINGNAQITGASSHYIWSLSNAGTGFTSAPAQGASDDVGTAGSRSLLAVNGNLNFQPGNIDMTGLGATGFDNTKFYSWTVATGSPASISSTQPTFNTTNLNTGGGTFFLSSNGTSVFVSFSPVPEPASILLCCAAVAGVTGFIRRRRAPR